MGDGGRVECESGGACTGDAVPVLDGLPSKIPGVGDTGALGVEGCGLDGDCSGVIFIDRDAGGSLCDDRCMEDDEFHFTADDQAGGVAGDNAVFSGVRRYQLAEDELGLGLVL